MDQRVVKDLLHIERWLGLAAQIVAKGRDSYLTDPLDQEAGDSLILKVGEAAKNIAARNQAAPDGIDWSNAARARDVIAHRYDVTDRAITWGILSRRFPEWQAALVPLFAEARRFIELES